MHNEPVAAGRSIFPWPDKGAEKGPTEGNHRLTALTGALLTPVLGLVFLTGLFMDTFWHVHYAVGFVLIPLVALKLISTGYRMMRYYTRSPIYQAAGPPDLVSRLLAPILVVAIVTALTTGVALFLQHSRSGVLSSLHTDSAVISAFLVGIHLLTHTLDALASSARELRGRLSRPAAFRVAIAAGALALGIVLAIVTYSSGVWPARHRDRPYGNGFSSSPAAGALNRVADPTPPIT
ncbi:MAG TPA: hypothetical protein VNL71_14780 [Chloroflexota bacterium]|nr:hypothetical protein [Chloroflexota bacterium]